LKIISNLAQKRHKTPRFVLLHYVIHMKKNNPAAYFVNMSNKKYRRLHKYLFVFQLVILLLIFIQIAVPLFDLIFDLQILSENPAFMFINGVYFYVIGVSLCLSGFMYYISKKRFKALEKKYNEHLNNHN
jgi:hypothetical protein